MAWLDSHVEGEARLQRYEIGYTTADLRAIMIRPVGYDLEGQRTKPGQVVCAEPSPDVAKAMSEAISRSMAGDIKVPETVKTPEIAASLALASSRSRAESMAQLTQRLATIQLLRDGLYRACEAYANGAISAPVYSVMISRYDDTMITMLLGEIAGGVAGGSGAALGMGASGEASAAAGALDRAAEDRKAAADTKAQADAAQKKLDEASSVQKVAAANAVAPGPDEKAAADAKKAEADKELELAKAQKAAADQNLETQATASASSKAEAKTVIAATRPQTSPSQAVAHELAEMQRKYLENVNADAIMVACITALTENPEADKGFAKQCAYQSKEEPGLISTIISEQHTLLRKKFELQAAATTVTNLEKTIDELTNVKAKLKKLNGESPPTKAAQ